MGLMNDFRNWRDYRRTVDQLSRLPDSTLKDIGLERDNIKKHVHRSIGY